MPVRLDEVDERDTDNGRAKIEFMIVLVYVKDMLPVSCLSGEWGTAAPYAYPKLSLSWL
jgi:hypothetical protein